MMPQELWLSWLGEGKACECRSWRSWACNSLAHLRITTRATKRCWKTGDIQSRQRRNTHLDALGSWHPEGEKKAGTQENAKVLLCITGLLRYRSTWAWKPWCGPLQPTWHTWQKWDQSVLVRPFTTPFRQLGWKTKFIHKSISEVLWKHVHLGFPSLGHRRFCKLWPNLCSRQSPSVEAIKLLPCFVHGRTIPRAVFMKCRR